MAEKSYGRKILKHWAMQLKLLKDSLQTAARAAHTQPKKNGKCLALSAREVVKTIGGQ